MIPDAIIKRLARQQGVDPMVIDLDHALGIVLWAMTTPTDAPRWVFKGGTCLRKAYFADYRFSEDLDFTVPGPLTSSSVTRRIEAAARKAIGRGVELVLPDMRTAITDDEYGRESIEVLIPYRGSLQRGGSPRNIRLHLSADEAILSGTARRELIHPYQDAEELDCTLECYSLEEMLAEKLRAVGGQRKFAIARDVYDIAQLADRGADVGLALDILPAKASAKSVRLSDTATRFIGRREEYRADWERSLAYLVSDDSLDFGAAFEITSQLLTRAQQAEAGHSED